MDARRERGLATDWPDDACATDAIMSVCSALYSCAGRPGTSGLGDIDAATTPEGGGVPTEPIGIVLVAALARHNLAQRGGSVTPRELATLAGVTDDYVRALARKGELSVTDGVVKRAEARRWLAARGVPGFE